MVIYAQRVRQQVVGLGVASATPAHLCTSGAATFAPATCGLAVEEQGMTLPVERTASGCGMPMGNGATPWQLPAGVVDVPAAARLSSLPTTTKRDAFAGILPGPCSSMSPPV